MTFKHFDYTEYAGHRLDHYARSMGKYGHDLHEFITGAIQEQHDERTGPGSGQFQVTLW